MKSPLKLFSKNDVCLPLVNRAGKHVAKYRWFKTFLGHNRSAMDTIALMEQLYHSGNPFTLAEVNARYEELLESAFGAVYALEGLSGKHYAGLASVLDKIDKAVSRDLDPHCILSTTDLVLPFDRITPEMKKSVGGKAANLAGAGNTLALPVPQGFAVTAYAFKRFMDENGLSKTVHTMLSTLSPDTPLDELERRCKEIQSLVTAAPVPGDIAEAILGGYRSIEDKTGSGIRLAMRSSAVGEDDEATFAGQYATVLNVKKDNILDAYKTVLASKYSAHAVSYRMQQGLDDRETPMGVAGVVMIDARSSGVLYTADPASQDTGVIKIHALWGLGEYLVSGCVSPDVFLVNKQERSIVKKEISRKEHRLRNIESEGTSLEDIPFAEQTLPSLQDDTVMVLADVGMRLEEFFGSPQDVEWAIDQDGKLSVLQSRPLPFSRKSIPTEEGSKDFPGHPVLIAGGETASPGIAGGTIFIVREGARIGGIPENSIVVVKTASPNYAKLAGTIRGIITEIGSTASHLASVVREFGIPAIFNMRDAMTRLPEGSMVTLDASRSVVYQGLVEDLLKQERPRKKHYIESAIHQRTRHILDSISPLNLTDPGSPSFIPEVCRTVHDVIRYTHEETVRKMFGLTEEAEAGRSVRLAAKIPLILHVIDLGGGLRQGLTTCDSVTPGDIESIPMRAVWKGFTHPGISWEGSIGFDPGKLLTIMAASATSEFGEAPGGISYALISGDYLNLSAKFGYHFSTMDSLCGHNSSQNYISLHFAGGAGSYYGKTLRVAFLGSVLERLGFQVAVKGDLIEAFITGYDCQHMEVKLDQMGRLLASTRLLDMALTNQSDVSRASEAFFNEEYDFLAATPDHRLHNYYIHGGTWKKTDENGRTICIQDGSKAGFTISSGVARAMGKLVGQSKLQDFLDNIGAYFYFPLAIARDSEIGDGVVRVRVKPVSGNIDRAGGIVFGLHDVSNYYVLRINALEDNVILFEFVNSKRVERARVPANIHSDRWYDIAVGIQGNTIKGFLDNGPVMTYTTDKPIHGFIGLWTKADSVTEFGNLTVETGGHIRTIDFD
jgi:pyruvate,water dikinase